MSRLLLILDQRGDERIALIETILGRPVLILHLQYHLQLSSVPLQIERLQTKVQDLEAELEHERLKNKSNGEIIQQKNADIDDWADKESFGGTSELAAASVNLSPGGAVPHLGWAVLDTSADTAAASGAMDVLLAGSDVTQFHVEHGKRRALTNNGVLQVGERMAVVGGMQGVPHDVTYYQQELEKMQLVVLELSEKLDALPHR